MVLTKYKEETQQKTRQLSVGLFLLLSLSIIGGLFFREPWLWMDEVLSYLLVSDPSSVHMNDAIVSNMDANPPLFPNLYWLIGHGISLNPLFLRSISVVVFAGTIVLFFRYTTRLIGNPITNFVLITAMVYFTYQNFVHSTGIRSYAILLPISCGYFISIHQLISNPANKKLLGIHTLLGLLMVFCHNYGLFYLAASGAFFLCLLIWSKQRSYFLVLSTYSVIVAIWLITWYPSFAIQSRSGQPHSWIPLPTLYAFFSGVADLIPSLSDKLEFTPAFSRLRMFRVLLMVGLFLYVAISKWKAGFQAFQQDKAFQFFLLSGFIYLAVLAISLTVTFTYTSIFLSRYMWPSQLLIMYQLIYIYYHFVGKRRIVPNLVRLLPVYSLILGGIIFYKNWKLQTPFPNRILTYLPQLDAQYPVFVERADYFLPIWFHKQRNNVTFLLDWSIANRPDNIRSATTDYKILTSVKEKYNVKGIIPARLFDAAHFPHFYVVDEQPVYLFEEFISRGQIKIIKTISTDMPGVRLLECTF